MASYLSSMKIIRSLMIFRLFPHDTKIKDDRTYISNEYSLLMIILDHQY